MHKINTTNYPWVTKQGNLCHSQPCFHCNSRALPHGDHHAAADDGHRGAPSASLLCEEADWKGELQVEGGVFCSHHGRAKTSGILPTMLMFVSLYWVIVYHCSMLRMLLSYCIPMYTITGWCKALVISFSIKPFLMWCWPPAKHTCLMHSGFAEILKVLCAVHSSDKQLCKMSLTPSDSFLAILVL